MAQTYTEPYQVFLDDIDYWGVVSHHKWIAIFERLRTKAFAEPFKELLGAGFGLVVAGLTVSYKKPGIFNQKLTVEITPQSVGRASFEVKQVARDEKGEVLVEANVHLVYVDRAGRPVKVPDDARKRFLE
ncbi:MAG: acyl-CoA thioesterase [Bdellovibrionaceae bacterium]|nr:acyl-CoA thioesterase [Bdellovibrionales bacterium]MCB9254570.1 acyl-CoA thioesterase [Pseudobdellovibrionaceae bacterium]